MSVPLCNVALCFCRYDCWHVHVAVGCVLCGCQQLQSVGVVCWCVKGTDGVVCWCVAGTDTPWVFTGLLG